MKVASQSEFGFARRGGRRPGAGRKLAPGKRRSVSHKKRPSLKRRHPVHVVMRLRSDVTNLRGPAFGTVLFCLREIARRTGFRVVHFSVQSNHLHLIVEADDEVALSRGMQALAIRIAKNLNQALARSGSVFSDHYFAEQMRSPAQVRHTLRYVLRNRDHHAGHALGRPDSRSSEDYLAAIALPANAPVSMPATWLLTVGWRTRKRSGAHRVAPGFDPP
jgi:REP element-mobilizing transposase RayT